VKYPSLPLCGEEGAKGNKEYNLHFIKAVEKKNSTIRNNRKAPAAPSSSLWPGALPDLLRSLLWCGG